MSIPFDRRLRVPEEVLMSELEGESVLLNLRTETYFGLDEVGTRMWTAVTKADSVQTAYDALTNEFDVDPAELREDLSGLIEKLLGDGLLVWDS